MNNKITIYELLGLVKDEPAKIYIKYYDRLNKKENIMWACQENIIYNLNNETININDEVEITKKEEDKIKKLKIKDQHIVGTWENGSSYCYKLSSPQVVLVNKINEIIKELNHLEEYFFKYDV